MNVVVISGRLTKKPELRTTQTGIEVCNFSLAVDNGKVDENGKRGVDFIECTSFGKLAQNLCKYQDKGSMLELKGRIQVDRYTNNEGKNVTRTTIYAETINYISRPQTNGSEAKNNQNDPYKDFGNKISNEYQLPF